MFVLFGSVVQTQCSPDNEKSPPFFLHAAKGFSPFRASFFLCDNNAIDQAMLTISGK